MDNIFAQLAGTDLPLQAIPLICVAGGMLLLIWFVTSRSGGGSLNIKMKTVGNGQHGTARWATPKEISQSYTRVLFKVEDWRKGKDLPKAQGLILGSTGPKNKVLCCWCWQSIPCTGPSWFCSTNGRASGCATVRCFASNIFGG